MQAEAAESMLFVHIVDSTDWCVNINIVALMGINSFL